MDVLIGAKLLAQARNERVRFCIGKIEVEKLLHLPDRLTVSGVHGISRPASRPLCGGIRLCMKIHCKEQGNKNGDGFGFVHSGIQAKTGKSINAEFTSPFATDKIEA